VTTKTMQDKYAKMEAEAEQEAHTKQKRYRNNLNKPRKHRQRFYRGVTTRHIPAVGVLRRG